MYPEELNRDLAAEMEIGCYISIAYLKGAYLASIRMRRSTDDKLRVFQENFGGYLGSNSKNGVVWYWWNLSSLRAIRILHIVYPYLEKNKVRAEVVFELENSMSESKKRKGFKLSPEVVIAREEMMKRLKQMNKVL